MPKGPLLFDAHLHIIDPRFPLVSNEGYVPQPFTVDDYRARTAALGVAGGAVVSGSFQLYDQTYLLDALERLGASFVGVTQLEPTASDEEILRLDAAGVRAARFNIQRGVTVEWPVLDRFARRVYELAGWHVELYIGGAALREQERKIAALPRAAIDHLGLSRDSLAVLTKLLEGGAWVKATGFGRLDFDPLPELRRLVSVRGDRVVFGTDLPSTRAPRPFQDSDLAMIIEGFDREQTSRLLLHNAVELYRPRRSPTAPPA